MARIKSKKYEIDGQTIEVNFNCSPSGIFSTNLHCVIVDKLGIGQSKLEGGSLKEIEDVLTNAFIDYKEAKTFYKAKIAIVFGASGDFVRLPDGELNDKFFGAQNPYKLSTTFLHTDSIIGLDYKVIIEENRDGRINYYNAIHKSKLGSDIHPWNKEVDCFITTTQEHIRDNFKLIDYSESALLNLQSITKQMQKASSFLIDILSSDKVELILNSGNIKEIGSGF
jgi:hypothetical protein